MLVRVPASSANLGPGFDTLGMALTLHAEVGLGDAPEGCHPADNVAASLYGGVVATAGGRAVRVPMSFDPAMVMWVPSFVTSTDESRTKLRTDVPMDDVVFNLGRTALLVAALAAGEIDVLREATRDRLHQDVRLAAAAPSKAALEAALDAGAWASWLSGSGPTVAAMCAVDEAEELAAALPTDGHTKILRIDHAGAVVEAV